MGFYNPKRKRAHSLVGKTQTMQRRFDGVVMCRNLARTKEELKMNWEKISEKRPPREVWLEFYDGYKSMGHHPPFNHIDIISERGEARVNYLHNYTHWRHLSAPNTYP